MNMKTLLAVAIFLSFVTPSFGQEVSVTSYAFGKKYSCNVPDEKLAKSPSWDMQSDNPPFPLGKAIRLANVVKGKLVKDSEEYKWHFMSVTLGRLSWMREDDPKMKGKCWWSILYEAPLRYGASTGQPDSLIVVVLMDGTVIDPKVSDYKSSEDYQGGHWEREKSGKRRYIGGG